MDQPLRIVTDEVLIAYHQFDLEDAVPENIEEPPTSDWYAEDNLTVHQGIVYLVSPGHTLTATVTMQAWADEPPRQPDDLWELIADVEFVCRSGRVIAASGMHGHRTAPLELSSGPMLYHLRVNSRGHERMRGLEGGGLVPEDGEEDRPGEEYLFQFWPARRIPDDLALPFHEKRSPRVPHGM